MHAIREDLNERQMLDAGLYMVGETAWERHNKSVAPRLDDFKAHFGSHPLVYAKLWNDMKDIDGERKLGYFIICLYWLKSYDTEKMLASRFHLDEETIRSWCWYYGDCIAEMQATVIKLPALQEDVAFPIAVDGVHCRIYEPKHPKDPYDKSYSSKKFGKKAAFAYEVAVSLTDQTISWIRGPYEAGSYTDTVMFKEGGLKYWLLSNNKQAFADAIYTGEAVSTPCGKYDCKELNQYKRRGRAKTETLNSRFKSFGVLKQCFRHKIQRKKKHESVFMAVAVIVAYQLVNGSPLFEM